MKNVLVVILVLVIGLLCYEFVKNEVVAYDVADVIEKNTKRGQDVLVKGIVSQNFNILNKGGYQLKDGNTGQCIYVCKDGASPQVGDLLTIRLKKLDIVTFNDNKISFYKEYDD